MIEIAFLSGDEACALFHCSKKERCSGDWTFEATLGR
jgi:hypothetical protein